MDWSQVKSPLDRQRQAFDDLVADSARLLREHPQYKWTSDFAAAVRRLRHEPLRIVEKD